jgi:chemotaxis-related protein WspB
LLVTFRIGTDRHGLPARDIVAVTPLPRFRELPQAPYYVLGLFQHRGQLVPAIDLSALAGRGPCNSYMSTRVILVCVADAEGLPRLLGLVAEQVTDTVAVDVGEGVPSPVQIPEASYLGDLFSTDQGLLQAVKIDDLLPKEVKAFLYPTEQFEWTITP